MELTYDNYLQHYGVKGMKWGSNLKKAVEDGLNNAADSVKDNVQENASDAKAAVSEMKAAFQGGDDGYGGLLEIVGSEEKAIKLLDMLDAAGDTYRTAKVAGEEISKAYQGKDWGYGATSEILKNDKVANTTVNAAAAVGERSRHVKKLFGLK